MAESGIAVVSLIIGLMIGATGIGGFLIIPAYIALLGLPVRVAVGTALVMGAVSGALGIYLFSRRGTLDWPIALPLVTSAALMAAFGGWVSQYLQVSLITLLLGVVVAAGSAAAFARATGRFGQSQQGKVLVGRMTVPAIGMFSGLVAGITGAGGPVASIPLMVAVGFTPLVANGVGTVLQLTAGAFGAAVYGSQGLISAYGLIWSVPFQLCGLWLGIVIAHRLDQSLATRIVAMIGILAGVGLVLAAIFRG